MPALLNNGARKTAGCYSSSEARENVFTAAICTCWMDNMNTNSNTTIIITNSYNNSLLFGQNRFWMHVAREAFFQQMSLERFRVLLEVKHLDLVTLEAAEMFA